MAKVPKIQQSDNLRIAPMGGDLKVYKGSNTGNIGTALSSVQSVANNNPSWVIFDCGVLTSQSSGSSNQFIPYIIYTEQTT